MYLANFNWFDYLLVLIVFLLLSPKKHLLNYIPDMQKSPTTGIFIGIIACLVYIIMFYMRMGESSIITYAFPIGAMYVLLSPGVLFEYTSLTGCATTQDKDTVSFDDMFVHSLFMLLAVVVIHNVNRCTSGPAGGCKPQFDVFKKFF